MKHTCIIFISFLVFLSHSALLAHIKFSEAERTIIRLQDERRGIDTIARFLDSKNEKVTWRAAVALANIHDTTTRHFLIAQLSKEIRPHAIEGIVFALGVLGPDKNSYDALVKVIPREPSNELFIALGRTVAKEDAENFASLLDDSKLSPIFQANALVEIGLRKLMNEDFAKKVDELEKNDNPEIRWRSIYSLARTEDSSLLYNHIGTIKEYLQDIGSSESRMFAAIALGRIHNQEAGKMLIDAGRSETEWRVRVNIFNAIGKMPRFSSAIYDIIKRAVSESEPDSSVYNHVARSGLDLLDGMITAGKLSSPDSATVGEWLSEFPLSQELHQGISSLIGSQVMIPLARLRPHDYIKDITEYLGSQHPTVVMNASTALGLIPDTLAVLQIVQKTLHSQPPLLTYQLHALHSLWQLTKTDSVFRKHMDKRNFGDLYKNLLLRFGNLVTDASVIATTMEYIQDSLVVTDSIRKEAEGYLLQYLDKFSYLQYRDQLISVLGAIQWLKPKNDTFTIKLFDIRNKSALEWGDQGVFDSVGSTIAILHPGMKFKSPIVKLIRDSIPWDQIERMPDTLVIQSKYNFLYIKLNTYEAPLSAFNMYSLAKISFFAGSFIHRIVPNFVIQLGDPTGTGEGGPGYMIRTEIAPNRYDSTGVCGMASSGKDTEGSQWFITHCPTPHLNTRYTIWGEVAIGKERIEKFQPNDQIDNLIPYR